VVTCIVPVDGAPVDEALVIARCKAEIASFKVPRRVLFFTDADYAALGAVTGSGKLKSSEVRTLAIGRMQADTARAF
jgi:fatty-acyl-CoA synthase